MPKPRTQGTRLNSLLFAHVDVYCTEQSKGRISYSYSIETERGEGEEREKNKKGEREKKVKTRGGVRREIGRREGE